MGENIAKGGTTCYSTDGGLQPRVVKHNACQEDAGPDWDGHMHTTRVTHTLHTQPFENRA